MRSLTFALVLFVFSAACNGAQADEPNAHSRVDAVRAEAAKVLRANVSEIDVSKPLGALGADELDVVEIVLAVERVFNVKIPDSALGEKPSKSLTVQQLAEIAEKQPKAE